MAAAVSDLERDTDGHLNCSDYVTQEGLITSEREVSQTFTVACQTVPPENSTVKYSVCI